MHVWGRVVVAPGTVERSHPMPELVGEIVVDEDMVAELRTGRLLLLGQAT